MLSGHQKSKPNRGQRLNVNNPGPTAQGFMQLNDNAPLKGMNKPAQHHPALRDVVTVPYPPLPMAYLPMKVVNQKSNTNFKIMANLRRSNLIFS